MEAPEPCSEMSSPVTPSLTDTVMSKHLDRVLPFTPKKQATVEKLASPVKTYMGNNKIT